MEDRVGTHRPPPARSAATHHSQKCSTRRSRDRLLTSLTLSPPPPLLPPPFHLPTQKATEDHPTIIDGEIKGLTEGKHAFAINVYGDLTSFGESTGSHFNPFGKNHGAPEDEERHVGSLGELAKVCIQGPVRTRVFVFCAVVCGKSSRRDTSAASVSWRASVHSRHHGLVCVRVFVFCAVACCVW